MLEGKPPISCRPADLIPPELEKLRAYVGSAREVTMAVVAAIRERFPQLLDPPSDDICYATQNRQSAVKQIAASADLVIVVGSRNSSNSNRMVEVALAHGVPAAHLVDDASQIDEAWLDGVDLVAVFMLGRHGIKGGESRVFEADGPAGQRFTLTEPWSLLLLDDARVIHETTPIQPLVPGELGWRDTLVLTYRRNGFQGD